jgi:type IV pilus assembly protein PilE
MRKITTLGFTLIELMVALAISAILIALGYPAYAAHEAHAERERAIVALMQLSAEMEVYASDHGTYRGATIRHLKAANLVDGLQYHLQIKLASDVHYRIMAVPYGIQAERDAGCGALVLTDTNQKRILGSGSAKACWM